MTSIKSVLEFVKVEHTLFSLPFIFIGYVIATIDQHHSVWDILSILLAAVGARGLAMVLNRIIDREIDARNPRTANRHIPSGEISVKLAWVLAALFLGILLIAAHNLSTVALSMAWLPVIVFVIYPYLKRFSWMCHFWLGLALGLAPAGAWVAIKSAQIGWPALVGSEEYGLLWYPEIFWISFGVALWIASFDINYARMDVENDRIEGIHSFPSRYGSLATTKLTVVLTIGWFASLIISGLHTTSPNSERGVFILWIPSAFIMMVINLIVSLKGVGQVEESKELMDKYQRNLFRGSMMTGWVLLVSLVWQVAA